jgi:hypothetical protein
MITSQHLLKYFRIKALIIFTGKNHFKYDFGIIVINVGQHLLKTDFWFTKQKLRFPGNFPEYYFFIWKPEISRKFLLSHPLWGCGAGPIGAWEIGVLIQ